jgi:tetratricopeptide (TPR) repeat protein
MLQVLRGMAALALLLVLLAGTRGAAAQAPPSQTDLNAAFEQLLRDPTSVELNLRFGEIAARQGNAEAAIGALERLLLERPDLVRVRLQLGLLYLKLGSYAMARAYLEPVASADTAPPDVREAAASGLRTVDRLASRHRLSGSIFAGFQTQTDPGASPASPVFLVGGVETTQSASFAKKSDYDFFGQGGVTYGYDLGTGYDEQLEIDGNAYAAFFSRQHDLDFAWGAVTIGPRLSTERIGLSGGSVRPYVLGSYAELGRNPYYNAYGGGLDYGQRFGDALPVLTVSYQGAQQNYQNSDNYPVARELNGRLDYYSVGVAQPVYGIAAVGLVASLTRQNARFSGVANDDYAVAANASIAYGAGLSPFRLPLATTLSLVRHYVAYDAPDASVSSTIHRADKRWQIVVGEVLPVTDSVALKGQFYRDINSSNLRNFSYTNTSFLIGPQLSF